MIKKWDSRQDECFCLSFNTSIRRDGRADFGSSVNSFNSFATDWQPVETVPF